MTFNHTRYKHEKGLRSRPRNGAQMQALFTDLEQAIEYAATIRSYNRGKNLPSRNGTLQTARARLEAPMEAVRQEQARNSRDPELTHFSQRARAEKRLIMRMLGEWK